MAVAALPPRTRANPVPKATATVGGCTPGIGQPSPKGLLALAGRAEELEDVAVKLRYQLPTTRIADYPIANLDTDLVAVADDVLRDAATVAAEAEGLTVTEPRVVSAIESGIVSAVLVNDDLNDTRVWDGDRLGP